MKKTNQKVILMADLKNQDLLKKVASHIKKLKNYEVVVIKNETDFVKSMIDNFKKYVYKNKKSRMIIIDDYGILPFMVTAKLPGSIVAQLEDEHSAYMTMGHNNSNVVSIGSQVVGYEVMLSVIEKYLVAKYEGGRHKVRLDMLDKLLEKETL